MRKDTLKLKHYLAEAATETRQMMERATAAEKQKEEHQKAKL
jgi:carnitine O-acetyltransferase